MAKKKTGRPPSGRPLPPVGLQVRCTPEWEAYIIAFARERGTDKSGLIEEAIKWYAAHMRRKPPPSRTGGTD